MQTETWIAFITLTFLEIVLGIDNIIFISIVSNKLPEEKQPFARVVGLAIALIFRIALLIGISWIIGFTKPIATIFDFELSGRDIILSLGGLFLIAKSVSEIHEKMVGHEEEHTEKKVVASMFSVISQIILLDVIFSFDSILTAVGLTDKLPIMISAVIVAIIIMMVFSGKVSRFINKYPTLQILALSFLILIGFMLMVESLHYHVPKGYIYFAVFFSLLVEAVNIQIRKKKIKRAVEQKKIAHKNLKIVKPKEKDSE